MNVALNRKRSRLALEDEDDDEKELRQPEASSALSVSADTLKRTKTQSELEELDIISAEDAWTVDVESIIKSSTLEAPQGSNLRPHNNVGNFRPGESIFVLCVQGNVRLHYNILWYRCQAFERSVADGVQLHAAGAICNVTFITSPRSLPRPFDARSHRDGRDIASPYTSCWT